MKTCAELQMFSAPGILASASWDGNLKTPFREQTLATLFQGTEKRREEGMW